MTRERAFEAVPSRDLTPEQHAFAVGKHGGKCPLRMRTSRALKAAWLRGRTFAEHQRRGLRPLDTARRLA